MATKNTNRGSQSGPVDQVEGGPERGPEGQTTGVDERKQGAPNEEPAKQPGGGRHSESEKPDSPDSRWGSGKDQND